MSALAPWKRGWDPRMVLQEEALPALPTMCGVFIPQWDSGVMGLLRVGCQHPQGPTSCWQCSCCLP